MAATTTTTEESFLTRVGNDILDVTDQITALLTGELFSSTTDNTNNKNSYNDNFEPQPGGFVGGNDEFWNSLDEEEREMLQEQMMAGSPLQGIADNVLGDIMSNQQMGPQTPMEHFQAFKTAITWTEPFIIGLVVFQIIMFIICYYVSRPTTSPKTTQRLIVMGTIAIIVRSAEYINIYMANNWRTYCTQNYFDKRGIFTGIMFSGPLLLDCLLMLFMFLKEASKLVIEVKKQEISKKKKQQQEQEQNKEKGSTTTNNNKKKKTSSKKKD